jgi:hypothetical protein
VVAGKYQGRDCGQSPAEWELPPAEYHSPNYDVVVRKRVLYMDQWENQN